MQHPVSYPKSVVIVTHELYEGSAHALRDFLNRKKIPYLLFISHPFSIDRPWSYCQRYAFGRRVKNVRVKRRSIGTTLGYCIDFYMTCMWLLMSQLPRDTRFIGVNPLNTLPGFVCRALHCISTVTYYSIDFTPVRFSSRVLNWIYHTLEKYSVWYANLLWNVSPRIADGRKKYLHIDPTIYIQKVVPIGIWEHDIRKSKMKSVSATLIYVGHILKKQGLQKVIEALPLVMERFPHVHLNVLGGGDYEQTIYSLVAQLHLRHVVNFFGWVTNQKKIEKELHKADLAVATYEPYGQDTTNFSYYADPTKIKMYLAAGVPVIATDVPYNAKALARLGCAFVVKYDVQSIARVIKNLLSHENVLLDAKVAAQKVARTFTWERIFEEAFSTTI